MKLNKTLKYLNLIHIYIKDKMNVLWTEWIEKLRY